jgi:hypothetical protein
MAEPYEPKLTDALKGHQPAPEGKQPQVDGGGGRSVHPEQTTDQFDPADARQHNREVNEGIHGNKDRLVDIGRGGQAAGRQKTP